MKRHLILLFILINCSVFAQEYDDIIMVGAINELRINPGGFIPHIEEYIKKLEVQKKDGGLKFTYKPKKIVLESIIKRNDSLITVAKSLISILKSKKPLTELQINTYVYSVTKMQANYVSSINKVTHNGANNEGVYERMKEFHLYVTENCIRINGKSIYECLVVLLMDEAHRNNLLDKNVNQVSIAKSGNYWVQNFIKN
jgi:hypothetical protein